MEPLCGLMALCELHVGMVATQNLSAKMDPAKWTSSNGPHRPWVYRMYHLSLPTPMTVISSFPLLLWKRYYLALGTPKSLSCARCHIPTKM